MIIVPSGKNDNETLYVFTLSWTDKDNHVAGNCIRNVDIEYTIN